MRFTLHYDGPLPTKGSPTVKHQIREQLEPQLRAVWQLEPLASMGSQVLQLHGADTGNVSALAQRHGHTFAAIVSDAMGLSAELDVLMLRHQSPGVLVSGGDIDNRLKTLFDALSAPAQRSQMLTSMRSSSPEDPFFVLLDDDKLISGIKVDTDRLLGTDDVNRAVVTIRVNTRITKSMWVNMSLW